ncbi:phospholipase D family protein [Actinomycetota bacterium]
MARTDWLLTSDERANPASRLDARHPSGQAWSTGNHVRPLVHGAAYFAELRERIEATRAGDLILFTDWRGDPDERLTGEPGSEVAAVLGAADERGVDVRGLVWRSHWDRLQFSAEENRHLGQALQEHGAEVLLDMRVRTGGSHHQKFVVIRHRDDPARDIAYVGGIDLCHSRRDDARHAGDPQPQSMAEAYGPTPAWHDVQVAIAGPAVHDVETVFRERWEDPTPLARHPGRRLADRLRGLDTTPDPLPPQADPPPPVPGGTHAVQLLRTYPNLRHGRDYPFARGGERSVARGYTKALERAERLVYIEDQYLWSHDVADHFVETLRTTPGLHVIAVLPHRTDQDSLVSRVPQLLGRQRAMSRLVEAAGDRVAFYGVENHDGLPVYVHAKVCVMDDIWASVGSDNFNRRSWTHDSELSAAVVDESGDGHGDYARRLRLTLAAEHLDRRLPSSRFPGDTGPLMTGRSPADLDDGPLLEAMSDCVEPEAMFAVFAESARALQAWHDGGRIGPRPPGRLRPLDPPDLGLITRAAAVVPYRTVHDPDGRPKPLRRKGRY